ncbi:cobyrinate a,c-diamide synthase [Phytomonospora endophytica]|uniref:Cobyrinic acid a,c-diamide synthase n=1 Tax=Phytomonospora endophytica TaxID=714109 RepID=A0A841FTE7_9ACTN|nr:cobyrinate a,c-diamide synthase [Phytomonospora endophytica]MBB6038073.1 cobyrinic acid a,c-diamide synthase [Phytomonospora endophytica]GIG67463.1 hydrogenobyrinate a,c-diamide synthase [Phytomonospora endophytica]
MTAIPRFIVASPSSGHGKTAVTAGLLAALSSRGLKPAAFKIGPDYVDAGYLGLAGGRVGRNLDPQLTSPALVSQLFAHGSQGADIAVVEGTLGLFDGLGGRADTESTAQVAGMLRAPVILVVDCGYTGQSVAALVHGFKTFHEPLWLGGVILTRVVSDRHEHILRESLDAIEVPVLGVLRRRDQVVLPPRAQGLVPVVERSVEAVRAIRRLGELMLDSVDLDRLLGICRSVPPLTSEPWSAEAAIGDPVEFEDDERPLIAVAGGNIFSYSYAESLELMSAAGAEIAVVDPLRDTALPPGTKALVFGGGFPEQYVDELSANEELRDAVAELARTGAPVVAESSGFLWLTKEYDNRPMGGVLDAEAHSSSMLVLGYRNAVAQSSSVIADEGDEMTGHKGHRSTVMPRTGDAAAWKWEGGQPEGYVWRNVHASYLNLHWAGYPRIAHRLVAAAAAAT